LTDKFLGVKTPMYVCTMILLVLVILYNYYNIIIMHAESTDVVPPDEEDVANVFNNFRQMCQGNNVCN